MILGLLSVLIAAAALRAEDRAEVCCNSDRQASDLNSIRGLCNIVGFAGSFSSITEFEGQ